MKSLNILAALGVLALSACQTTTDATMADKAAAAPASAAAPFVGKSLTSDNGTVFRFMADGSIGGTLRGETPIVGTYTATATEVCSTYSAPEQLTGQEYCSAPVMSGDTVIDTVIFNRRDGSQSPAYKIQG